MQVRYAALIAAGMFAVLGSAASFAQTATPNLDECRAQAISKGLVGEARNASINTCMGSPAVRGVSTSAGTKFTGCRSDARGRGLSGDAFNVALDQCMAQSGAPAASGGPRTYQDCRSRAIGRGLAGEARNEFIDSCLND